jgi:CheY-like chemotaxis protein
MPMVDGFQSTLLIRNFETQSGEMTRAKQMYGRTPIFALSSGLQEDDEDQYANNHFDGWIPKPFDPARLALYLSGMTNAEKRKDGIYEKGKFARGGWFGKGSRNAVL